MKHIGLVIFYCIIFRGCHIVTLFQAKPKTHFLKKYGTTKSMAQLAVNDIRRFGRQILELTKYMTDKGFPMG